MIFPFIKPFHKFSHMTHVRNTFYCSFALLCQWRHKSEHYALGRFSRSIFSKYKILFLWNIDIFRNYHVIKRIWNEFSFHTVFMKLVVCFTSPRHRLERFINTEWNENSFQILYVHYITFYIQHYMDKSTTITDRHRNIPVFQIEIKLYRTVGLNLVKSIGHFGLSSPKSLGRLHIYINRINNTHSSLIKWVYCIIWFTYKEVNTISHFLKKSYLNLYFISSYWYSDHVGRHYRYEYAYYVVA